MLAKRHFYQYTILYCNHTSTIVVKFGTYSVKPSPYACNRAVRIIANFPNEIDQQTALDALGWEPLKEQRKKAKTNVQNIKRHGAQVSQWPLYFQKRSFESQSSRQLYYSLFATTTHKRYEKESYVRQSLHMELPTSKHKRE